MVSSSVSALVDNDTKEQVRTFRDRWAFYAILSREADLTQSVKSGILGELSVRLSP